MNESAKITLVALGAVFARNEALAIAIAIAGIAVCNGLVKVMPYWMVHAALCLEAPHSVGALVRVVLDLDDRDYVIVVDDGKLNILVGSCKGLGYHLSILVFTNGELDLPPIREGDRNKNETA